LTLKRVEDDGFVECVRFRERFELAGVIVEKVIHELFPFGCEAAGRDAELSLDENSCQFGPVQEKFDGGQSPLCSAFKRTVAEALIGIARRIYHP
jgi:hypothetical protein